MELPQEGQGAGDDLRRDPGVAGGGVDVAVAEQDLNNAEIGALFEQMSGEGVASMPRSA